MKYPFVLRDTYADIQRQVLQHATSANASDLAQVTRLVAPLLSNSELVHIVTSVQAELAGIGPLEDLLLIDGITDILVTRFDHVWIDGPQGLSLTPITWASESELRTFAARLANSVGRRLDDLNPCVDLQLKSGIRCHIALAPISVSGTTVSLRIPRQMGQDLQDIIGHQPNSVIEVVSAIVKSRCTFLITGSTGSGKSTLLSSMLGQVSPTERIVLIEDTHELRISHPHVVPLQARQPNTEGVGTISLRDLVRESLRMRPDRLVLGEVRGPEIVDLFTAFNTGHQGGASTLHANSSHQAITRVEALGMLAGLSRKAVRAQFSSAVDVIIHVGRDADGRRGVRNISMVAGTDATQQTVISCLEVLDNVVYHAGWETLAQRIELNS